MVFTACHLALAVSPTLKCQLCAGPRHSLGPCPWTLVPEQLIDVPDTPADLPVPISGLKFLCGQAQGSAPPQGSSAGPSATSAATARPGPSLASLGSWCCPAGWWPSPCPSPPSEFRAVLDPEAFGEWSPLTGSPSPPGLLGQLYNSSVWWHIRSSYHGYYCHREQD